MGIQSANPGAIKKLVAQLFEYGKRIIAMGSVPILEPEADITAKDKAEIEDLLLPELVAGLEKLGSEDMVIFKLSLPEKTNLYQPLMKFPQGFALSGASSNAHRFCPLILKASRNWSPNISSTASG